MEVEKNMEWKIVGIFVCTLLIIGGFCSVSGSITIDIEASQDLVDTTIEADSQQRNAEESNQFGNVIVIGIMNIIDASPEYKDYEISIIAIIIDGGGIHILKSGEMIRLDNFQGLEFASIVIGSCDDWGIIG